MGNNKLDLLNIYLVEDGTGTIEVKGPKDSPLKKYKDILPANLDEQLLLKKHNFFSYKISKDKKYAAIKLVIEKKDNATHLMWGASGNKPWGYF